HGQRGQQLDDAHARKRRRAGGARRTGRAPARTRVGYLLSVVLVAAATASTAVTSMPFTPPRSASVPAPFACEPPLVFSWLEASGLSWLGVSRMALPSFVISMSGMPFAAHLSAHSVCLAPMAPWPM